MRMSAESMKRINAYTTIMGIVSESEDHDIYVKNAIAMQEYFYALSPRERLFIKRTGAYIPPRKGRF